MDNNFKDYGMSNYFLDFKVYGKGGVMNMFPGFKCDTGNELLIIIEMCIRDRCQTQYKDVVLWVLRCLQQSGYSLEVQLQYEVEPAHYHSVYDICLLYTSRCV